MPFELAWVEFAEIPTGATPALVTLLLVAVTTVKLIKECRLWGEWFFPATAASVQVTVGGSEPKIKHTQPSEPAANHSSDSGAALGMQIGKDEQPQRLPAQHPIPVIQCSPRPNPVLREKGSPNCVHVFTIHAKNASGYNYMCRHCRQHWYRPWAEDEKQVQIKNRLCTAQVVTEVSLT